MVTPVLKLLSKPWETRSIEDNENKVVVSVNLLAREKSMVSMSQNIATGT